MNKNHFDYIFTTSNLSACVLCHIWIYMWGCFLLQIERVAKNNDQNYLTAGKKSLVSQKYGFKYDLL